MFWKPTPSEVWQGRNDLEESPLAKRIFQTVIQTTEFTPQNYPRQVALLGFACDEGVKTNKGRAGAKEAPDSLKKMLANLAAQPHDISLVDLGNVIANNNLQQSQEALSNCVLSCQKNTMKTLVIGGGHETAFAHGMGIYQSYPEAKIGIINFDAHLDIRTSKENSSGTPFRQLAEYCQKNNRPFNYLCIGASKAANTQALLQTAEDLNIHIIWDTDCNFLNLTSIKDQVKQYINSVDIIYLTIDLDVLPPGFMFAVSAPSALGVEPNFLLQIVSEIIKSDKLKAADVVEYNPSLDRDLLCARVAARFVWQIFHEWK